MTFSTFDRFLADRGAQFAIMLAILLLPLTGMVGSAIDYANATRTKQRLDQIADAAALAGVSVAASVDGNGGTYDPDRSKQIARAYFIDHATAVGATFDSSSLTVAAERIGPRVQVSVVYQSAVATTLGAVIAPTHLDIGGRAVATTEPPVFVDVIALVDASGSMGIGASPSDQALMQTHMGCTFACHGSGGTAQAHAAGARTRFDVVRSALDAMMADAQTRQAISGQFRFSVYKFANTMTEVLPPTTNLPNARLTLAGMQPDGFPGSGTVFNVALDQFKSKVPTGGAGTSPTDRKVFVLLLTDGIGDDVHFVSNGSYWYKDPAFRQFAPVVFDNNQYIQGFDARLCNPIKDKRATVLTLNTEYVTPPGTTDPRYVDIRDTLVPLISQNMAACASEPRLAYRANDAAEITRASREMFNMLVSYARLAE